MGIIILVVTIAIVVVVVSLQKRTKQRKLTELKVKYDNLKMEYQTNGLPTVQADSIKLTKGEVCHFVGNASFCKMKQEIVGYAGGSRGISVRVIKGVSFRIGNYKGHSIKKQVIKRNVGKIYLTSKKIIFSSIKNSSTIKINDIIALNIFEKLLQIQTDQKSYLFDIENIFNFLILLEFLINSEDA